MTHTDFEVLTMDSVEKHILITDEESINAISPDQARADYELFSKAQLNILEFYRKWKAQSSGDVPYSSEITKLAQELSKLTPEELTRLQKSMIRLVPEKVKASNS